MNDESKNNGVPVRSPDGHTAPPGATHRALRLPFLIVDAAAFTAAAYYCGRASLLRIESLSSMADTITVFALAAVAIFFLRYIYVRLYRAPFFLGLAAEFAVLFAIAVIPAAYSVSGGPNHVNAWISLWWNNLPRQLAMFAGESSHAVIFLSIALLIFILLAAFKFRRPLILTRAFLILFTLSFAALNYMRVLPTERKSDLLVFLNQPGVNVIALDTYNSELVSFATDSFKIDYEFSLETDWSARPRDLVPFGNLIYVLYDEQPGIAEFDIDTRSQEAGLRFLRPRAIAFRTGGWGLAAHKPTGALYAVAGAADQYGRSVLLKIDPFRFVTIAVGTLPDSGPGFIAHPEKPTAYSTSFFKPKIYEINLNTLQVIRVLHGPPACRALALDTRRNLIYAAGYYNGLFTVTDISSNKIIRSARVRGGVSAVKLDSTGDRLYIATSDRVIRVDLPVYLGEKGKTPGR